MLSYAAHVGLPQSFVLTSRVVNPPDQAGKEKPVLILFDLLKTESGFAP